MGMLASALRRHVGHTPLDDLQERLLDALAGDVSGDGGVGALAADLINFINVDDPALGFFVVVIRGLLVAQNDVLDVFTHVTGFGQGRGIGDRKWHVEHLSQCACEQCLTRASRPEQQDITLLDLNVIEFTVEVGEVGCAFDPIFRA